MCACRGLARVTRMPGTRRTVRTVRSLKQGSDARKKQKAYDALADNEDWLAKNGDKLA